MTENVASQDDNVNSLIARFLSGMDGHLKKISRNTQRNKIEFDEFLTDNGSTGQVSLQSKLIGPVVITDIMAAWSVTATSVILTIGNRVIPLPPAAGFYTLNMETGMQVDSNTSPISLVTSGVACFLEVQGFAAKRIMQ